MHKSIRVKLFLTFLVTTLLVVSGMYLFMRWSLDRGFSEFVETRQQEQVTSLIEGLTEYYANNKSWSNLAGDKQKWIDLLWQSNSHRHHRPPPWIKEARMEANDVWPPALTELRVKKHFIPQAQEAHPSRMMRFVPQRILRRMYFHVNIYCTNCVGLRKVAFQPTRFEFTVSATVFVVTAQAG
jgi:hypothetical protein